jgi:hypothetical protein
MAKSKTIGRPKSALKGKPIFSMKGVPLYKKWLDDLADHCGLPVTQTVAQSLMEYAEKRKFRPPPKR